MVMLLKYVYSFLMEVLLSADNAVVIAMAAANVPEKYRNQAIYGGMGLAIVFRLVGAFLLIKVLHYSFITAICALFLFNIAFKLIVISTDDEKPVSAQEQVKKAILQIGWGDFTMSIDNILAVSAIAQNIWMFIGVILLSIPLMMIGAKLLVKLIDKYPFIKYVGSALLTYVAGQMLLEDNAFTKFHIIVPDEIKIIFPIVAAFSMVGVVYVKNNLVKKQQEKVTTF